VAVREPVRAGSTSAGVGPVVATLTGDSPTSEARDQIHAVADVSTTQESSSVERSQVSGTTRVDTILECVRQTDRQTHDDGIYRIASRCKSTKGMVGGLC